jgi:hypothetical protein
MGWRIIIQQKIRAVFSWDGVKVSLLSQIVTIILCFLQILSFIWLKLAD